MGPFTLKAESILNTDSIEATLKKSTVTRGFKYEYTSSHHRVNYSFKDMSYPTTIFPNCAFWLTLPSLDRNLEDNICLFLSVLPKIIKYKSIKSFKECKDKTMVAKLLLDW